MSRIYSSKLSNEYCHNDGEYLNCKWYGQNDMREKIANGIYFCKITAGNQIFWEKIGVVQFR